MTITKGTSLHDRCAPSDELRAMEYGLAALKRLLLCDGLRPEIAAALREQRDYVTEVLRRTRNGYRYGP